MGKLLYFDVGCRRCKHLVEDEDYKGSYYCTAKEYENELEVSPIVNNNRTVDWNLCDGEYREWAGFKVLHESESFLGSVNNGRV